MKGEGCLLICEDGRAKKKGECLKAVMANWLRGEKVEGGKESD